MQWSASVMPRHCRLAVSLQATARNQDESRYQRDPQCSSSSHDASDLYIPGMEIRSGGIQSHIRSVTIPGRQQSMPPRGPAPTSPMEIRRRVDRVLRIVNTAINRDWSFFNPVSSPGRRRTPRSSEARSRTRCRCRCRCCRALRGSAWRRSAARDSSHRRRTAQRYS